MLFVLYLGILAFSAVKRSFQWRPSIHTELACGGDHECTVKCVWTLTLISSTHPHSQPSEHFRILFTKNNQILPLKKKNCFINKSCSLGGGDGQLFLIVFLFEIFVYRSHTIFISLNRNDYLLMRWLLSRTQKDCIHWCELCTAWVWGLGASASMFKYDSHSGKGAGGEFPPFWP